MMQRSPRTILAVAATLALTMSALGSTAALAKGPGGGSAECTGDCTADQPQAQQTRARDGSGSSTQTRTEANAGGGGQVQARTGNGSDTSAQTRNGGSRNVQQNRDKQTNTNARQNANGNGQNSKVGAGQGPNDDGDRGPGSCDDCDAEMGTLTDEQAAGLVYMANEEKMAHDAYAAFDGLYDLPIFGNIARSESRHQAAVNTVLERYGLEDSAFDLSAAEFSDPIIDSLYTTLLEQGSASLEEAIAVGVLIEETDIADLKARMEGLDETAPDVYEMYSHLLAGSENHLAAFQGRQ